MNVWAIASPPRGIQRHAGMGRKARLRVISAEGTAKRLWNETSRRRTRGHAPDKRVPLFETGAEAPFWPFLCGKVACPDRSRCWCRLRSALRLCAHDAGHHTSCGPVWQAENVACRPGAPSAKGRTPPPRRVRGAGGRDGAAEPRKGGGELPFAAGKQAGGLETASPLKGRRYWKTQMDVGACRPHGGSFPYCRKTGGRLTDGEEKMTKMPMELLFGGRRMCRGRLRGASDTARGFPCRTWRVQVLKTFCQNAI